MKGLFPGQIDKLKRSSTTGGQQIIFLMGMHVELPCPCLWIVGRTDCWAGVDDQITGI